MLFVKPALFYLLALLALSIALGVQIILLPWLVIDELNLSSIWVGWVQAAVLLPNLLLMLLGGLSADRHGVRYLWLILVINSLLHAALAYFLTLNVLSILLLLGYAIALGVVNAFVQPWREYLLHTINRRFEARAGYGLQSLVARSSLCVYIGQAIGVSLSSSMAMMGAEKLLSIQFILVVLSALAFCYLQRILSLAYQKTWRKKE